MKKFWIILAIIVIYFLIYFFQVNFFNWFTIAGIKPNLFILLVLFIGLFMNGKMGAILGFIIGLYTDFLFSQTIGISAILLGIIGFCGQFLDRRFSKDSKITIVIMASIVTAIYEIIYYLFRILNLSSAINPLVFIYTLSIEIIYNAFIIIIFYPLIHKYGLYIENIFKDKKSMPTRYF